MYLVRAMSILVEFVGVTTGHCNESRTHLNNSPYVKSETVSKKSTSGPSDRCAGLFEREAQDVL